MDGSWEIWAAQCTECSKSPFKRNLVSQRYNVRLLETMNDGEIAFKGKTDCLRFFLILGVQNFTNMVTESAMIQDMPGGYGLVFQGKYFHLRSQNQIWNIGGILTLDLYT